MWTRTSIGKVRGLCLGVALCGLSGCLLVPPFEPTISPTALRSHEFCQQGAACQLKPMAMVVLNKANPSVSFDFRSWLLYDPRPEPFAQRYVAIMNEVNDPVCEGYYTSFGIRDVTAPIALTCFPRAAQGRGKIRFYGIQSEGRFAGRSTGVGMFETDRETVYLVHGATPEENQRSRFIELWEKYGGKYLEPLSARQVELKRIPSLPRLVKGRPPAATAADIR